MDVKVGRGLRDQIIGQSTIISLIRNTLNRTKIMTLINKGEGNVEIHFRLTLPKWTNDKELLTKNPQGYIFYCSNKRTESLRYEVSLENVDKEYPRSIGSTKFLCLKRKYNICDWLSKDIDFVYFLRQERRDIFRETQSEIILQEVGFHSKRWDDITSGKNPQSKDLRFNYALSRQKDPQYTWNTLQGVSGIGTTFPSNLLGSVTTASTASTAAIISSLGVNTNTDEF